MRDCRHARIADYFGEAGVPRRCSACDNCLTARPPEEPIPVEAVMAGLAAVARFSGRVGMANVAAVLGGRQTRWSASQPWVEQLPFHGSLKAWSDRRVRQLLAEIVAAGLARQSSGEYPVVELTAPGREAIAHRSPPALTLPADTPGASRGTSSYPDAPAETVERLRRWRLETARSTGVPAYVVFHDSTLNAIAAARPTSLAELLRVPGVGDAKLRKYGEEVLELLRTPSG
jgi:ATP-dependent DNA helicase RecQ